MMTRYNKLVSIIFLAGMLLATTACSNRYLTNRAYDFRDTFALGAGVTAENPVTGVWPPSLGAYIELTDYLQLGAITHNGYTAEFDMRGTGVYLESRSRLGLLFWQAVHIDQDYSTPPMHYYNHLNYFKHPNTMWERWMTSPVMSWLDRPAKDLTYDHWIRDMQYGFFLCRRGYQYWGYTGAELAICEPFVTHLGVMLRAGVDISEFSDFLLGWFTVDFKHDDLTPEMYEDFLRGGEPTSSISVRETSSTISQADYDRLKAENERLAQALERCEGRLRELDGGGIEITLPDEVLFESGKARLRTSGRRLLDEVAQQIRSQYPGYRINVEGHTDDRPIRQSNWKSNWELGAARALTVVHYLNQEQGLRAYSASTYSYNKPVAPNDTPEGRQQNRRSVIVLRAVRDNAGQPPVNMNQ